MYQGDSLTYLYSNWGSIKYEISGNTYKEEFSKTEWNYQIKNDTLSIESPQNDTLKYLFAKSPSFNIRNFVDSRLGVKIPSGKHTPLSSWSREMKTITLKQNSKGEADLRINSTAYSLDSILHKNVPSLDGIIGSNDHLLFMDEQMPVSNLWDLEDQLYQARYEYINYVMVNNDTLQKLTSVLKPKIVEFKKPGSLVYEDFWGRLPYNINQVLVCEIGKDGYWLNDVKTDINTISKTVRAELARGSKPTLLVYFAPEVSYGSYVNHLTTFRQLYYDHRDQFVFKNYGIKDYTKLVLRKLPTGDVDRQSVEDYCPISIIKVRDKKIIDEIKRDRAVLIQVEQ